MATFDLDPSQQQAWEQFLARKNVGLFGRAGSGKSTVLGRAISHARRVHGVASVGVVAWTTTAASIIDGCTFHKFLGIKVDDRAKEVILKKVSGNRFVRDKLRKTKVIFVDEVPQFDSKWFSVFEYLVRQLAPPYKHALPWGVVQVVVGGDPLQLGPVCRVKETAPPPPVFMCRVFRDSFLSRYGLLVFLLGTHRQSSGGWFVQCLDRIRVGTFTDMDLLVLNATSAGVTDAEWASRTQLRALNKDVNEFNREKLAELPRATTVYTCADTINPRITHPARIEYIKKRLQQVAPLDVTVKAGAVVMLTREVEGIPTATQGTIEQCGEVSVDCVFGGKKVVVPLVPFDIIDNCGTLLGTRKAMPLLLAWAMTIHRAQGANLDSLAVDFSNLRWREPGLVYSGISRCRLFEHLYVRGLTRDQIVVCADAMSFYNL